MENAVAQNLQSSYLKHLPAFYSEDEFMGRFLMIFEDILTPIQRALDHVELYFDPKMMPEDLLPWLASWVDLVLDENWPVEKRRKLLGSAVELYRWRGTRRGLREYLRVYSGVEPVITEHIGGISLDKQFRLGYNTLLGEGQDHCFTVTLELEDMASIDLEMVRAIIEAEKPAHTAYTLRLVPKSDAKAAEEASSDVSGY
ncbi:MAG: phage tail protein [Dehalococcoidia bacterium]